ncbi:MAG: succinylglutamate desuccinylase/aspartoacylase family protein [Armatimonadetes bacterium]|nr:succinylglutamate desuccinylase/aspartoacylase family protein [Armatimonadota bacterium]
MPEAKLEYAVATLTDGSKVRTPFWRIDSGREGEAFMVLAAQHGNEVQGCEVIRRFREVCERELVAGSVWLVPFANLPAVRHRRSHISLGPEQPYGDDEGHNMNRTWPGDPDGNDTERVAHSLHEAVARHCTRCLDLHSWSRFTATATLTRRDGGLCEQMAEATAIRFVQWRTPPAASGGGSTPCTIGALFNDSGRGAVTIELAPQWVIREKEVAQGLRAATNLAKLFGMMEGEMELLDEQVGFERYDEADRARLHEVTAPCRGMFVEAGLETSDRVEKGQYLGHLIRDDNLRTVEITSPATGYLWEYGSHRAGCDVALPPQHPYTSAGDTLATVVEP